LQTSASLDLGCDFTSATNRAANASAMVRIFTMAIPHSIEHWASVKYVL
jgi:hypothetical protein